MKRRAGRVSRGETVNESTCKPIYRECTLILRVCCWTLLGSVGAIVGGFGGNAAVTTHMTILNQQGRATLVQVEVQVFDFPIHEVTSLVYTGTVLEERSRLTASLTQDAIIAGIAVAGVLIGAMVALGSGVLVTRFARQA